MVEGIASAYVYGYQDGINALWDSSFGAANKLLAEQRDTVEGLINSAESRFASAEVIPVDNGRVGTSIVHQGYIGRICLSACAQRGQQD